MPGAQRQRRAADKHFITLVAVEENQLSREVGAIRAADAQMLAARRLVAIRAAREKVAGHWASIGGQSIPEPQLDGKVFAERHIRANAATGEVRGAIDARAGEGTRRGRLRRLVADASVSSRQVERDAVLEGRIVFASRIARGGNDHFLEAPISLGLRGENSARVRAVLIGRRTSRSARDFFEQGERGLDDARLGVGFQSGRARGPRRVAAELVLLGWRDVALGAVGEFDVKRGDERAAIFQLQTGNREDLVRQRGDAEFTDAQRLNFQLRARAVMKVNGFERVNLRLRLRELVAELRGHLSRPRQALLVRHAIA